MSELGFEVIEFDGSQEHIRLLQEARVNVWSEGKSQEELGMGKDEILALGKAYMAQPNFVAIIIVRNGQAIGYCLAYVCDFWKGSLNLASEIVVSPVHEWDLVTAMCEQSPEMAWHFPGIEYYDHRYDGEGTISLEDSCKVWVMNGMGVVKSERGNFAITKVMIRKMMETLKRKYRDRSGSQFGLFYTWELEEHPSFYEQIGFQRVNFVDPEEIGKVANRKTYWLADWEEYFTKK